jgi:hypothetical protein
VSSRQITWRVSRATSYQDLRGHNITLTYDESGLGIASSTTPAALTLPWHRCRTRLIRRSNTWELKIERTPWGDLTLTTFRPAVTADDITYWEARGVAWSRWQWNRIGLASLFVAATSYVGIAVFMENHSVVRVVQRTLPSLTELPFTASVDDPMSPLSMVMAPSNVVIQKGLQLNGPLNELTGPILARHAACTGMAASHDRIFGSGGATPAAAVYSSVFQSTRETTFRIGVLSEVFSDVSDVKRDERQFKRTGITECVAATYGRLIFRENGHAGRIVMTHVVTVPALSNATIHAARATVVLAGERSEVYLALITHGHFRVTVVGVGRDRDRDEVFFSQTVATVTHKVTGDPVAAA